MTMAKRLKAMGSPKYQNDGDPRTRAGFGVSMHPDSVLEPILKWPRTSRIAFLDSMSDVFHARASAEFLGRIFATMALTPQGTPIQVLDEAPEEDGARIRRPIAGVQGATQDAVLGHRERWSAVLPDRAIRLVCSRGTAQCPWPVAECVVGDLACEVGRRGGGGAVVQ